MRHLVSGVGARLGLALLVVLLGAMALVYLIVVPSLESRLTNSRLAQLERAVPGIVLELPADRLKWPDFLEAASASSNARVVVFDTVGPPAALVVAGDSQGFNSADVQGDPIALRAALTRKLADGTTERSTGRFVEAATPIPGGTSVMLVSSPLHETLKSVALVRDRLIVAGVFALFAALAAGYLGALLFARRLRRLEAAAERIADGEFDEPVVDRGNDEVGELARAFDRMRERLAALDHARREFIANASHELRTPIFSLGGFLELLRDEEINETTRREFLATMSEQVDRLAKLATELLDLSRADAGRLRLERQQFALGALAETVVDEFAARANGRTLSLGAVEDALVLGDEQRVLQIGRVLVENALVHTPAATNVEVRVVDGRLEVVDDGPGIPAEHVPHVFDRFYRVEGERAFGSGLGLAIARELALAMGGMLEVESAPGETVFRLQLPQPSHAHSALAVR